MRHAARPGNGDGRLFFFCARFSFGFFFRPHPSFLCPHSANAAVFSPFFSVAAATFRQRSRGFRNYFFPASSNRVGRPKPVAGENSRQVFSC
jgi:hypothetical protein